MKVAVFSSQCFEKPFLAQANEAYGHELHFFEARLNVQTAALAATYPAISCFVSDELSAAALTLLAKGGASFLYVRQGLITWISTQLRVWDSR